MLPAVTRPRLPIGSSDFLQLRRDGLHYVDKSDFVTEVLRNPARVLLLPRPRRFGKTLNITTLAAYVERTKEDRTAAFCDLAVWRAGDDVRAHFGRYPVIFLTFKDVKTLTWTTTRMALAKVIAAECQRHRAEVEPVITDPDELRDWQALCASSADDATLWRALARLSEWLHRAAGERAVILIDEYDTPIHAAFHHGFYDQVIELFRNLFSGAFKDNPHLTKGVLTGILRVSKESVFSGLNNVEVHTILSKDFSTYFGFSPEEVSSLAKASGQEGALSEIERWYNGYSFGGHTVYNPWSVLNYLAHPEDGFKSYWVQTSSDDILRELLIERGRLAEPDLETLLTGGSVTKLIDEHIVLRDVRESADPVWSFLLFSGYLKALSSRPVARRSEVVLAVPNLEVRDALEGMFADFLSRGLSGSERVPMLCKALLEGDDKTFGRLLGELLLTTLSYHDTARPQREGVYQAFVLGLLVTLEKTHEVTANREAGYGRYDVMISPRQHGRPGAVLELKVIDTDEGETKDTALESALQQITERDYASALRERGATPVHELAAVFDGKRAWVRKRT